MRVCMHVCMICMYVDAVHGGESNASTQSEMILAGISGNLECLGWLSKVCVYIYVCMYVYTYVCM